MNRQKSKYLICLLLFMPFTVFDQRAISGQITDAEDKEPIAGAQIRLKELLQTEMVITGSEYLVKAVIS